jgi:hypothetical protein
VKKAFESNPMMKMTEFALKKKISVATVSRAIEQEGGKSLRRIQASSHRPYGGTKAGTWSSPLKRLGRTMAIKFSSFFIKRPSQSI